MIFTLLQIKWGMDGFAFLVMVSNRVTTFLGLRYRSHYIQTFFFLTEKLPMWMSALQNSYKADIPVWHSTDRRAHREGSVSWSWEMTAWGDDRVGSRLPKLTAAPMRRGVRGPLGMVLQMTKHSSSLTCPQDSKSLPLNTELQDLSCYFHTLPRVTGL